MLDSVRVLTFPNVTLCLSSIVSFAVIGHSVSRSRENESAAFGIILVDCY